MFSAFATGALTQLLVPGLFSLSVLLLDVNTSLFLSSLWRIRLPLGSQPSSSSSRLRSFLLGNTPSCVCFLFLPPAATYSEKLTPLLCALDPGADPHTDFEFSVSSAANCSVRGRRWTLGATGGFRLIMPAPRGERDTFSLGAPTVSKLKFCCRFVRSVGRKAATRAAGSVYMISSTPRVSGRSFMCGCGRGAHCECCSLCSCCWEAGRTSIENLAGAIRAGLDFGLSVMVFSDCMFGRCAVYSI